MTIAPIVAKSIMRLNAEKDPAYCPYCLRCTGLVRMVKVETFLWKCKCGAVHDERDAVPVRTIDLSEEQYTIIQDQGWCAGYDDLLPDCPYPEGSPEAAVWNDGYAQGSSDC